METMILWILAFLSQFGFIDIIRRLKDQRGEVAPDDGPKEDIPGEVDDEDHDESLLPEEEDDDDVLDGLDDVDLEGFDEKEDKTGEEALKEKIKPSAKEEGEETPDKKELKRLQGVVTGLRDDKVSLNKALHKERTTKKEETADPPLTRQQLLAIYKEHSDDPDTAFNVLEYIAKQYTKGIKTEVTDAAKVSEKKNAIEKQLFARWPDLLKEDSEIRTNVDQLKENFGIADSPYGDFFAMGAMVLEGLDGLLKTAKEQGRKEASEGKVEKTRKEKLKGSDLVPKAKTSKEDGVQLTESQRETAKMFNFKEGQIKLYAKLLKKNKDT